MSDLTSAIISMWCENPLHPAHPAHREARALPHLPSRDIGERVRRLLLPWSIVKFHSHDLYNTCVVRQWRIDRLVTKDSAPVRC